MIFEEEQFHLRSSGLESEINYHKNLNLLYDTEIKHF